MGRLAQLGTQVGGRMSRPLILDLFCCQGGAAAGYARAGFDVVGVDVVPQPRYPFRFIEADALDYPLDGYAAVHASPPCQDHSALSPTNPGKRHGTGWMLAATIDRLIASGLPYVIENVPGADMPGAFTLCGRSFGIAKLKRHRQFLTNVLMLVPPCACTRAVRPIGVYGDLSKNDRRITTSHDPYVRMRAGVATARELLDCHWMDADGLTQAIPPVYTEFIGEQLLDHIRAGVAA
jgi:DNA (cytosine-5)-methyltransferase 1